jgi:hypothetical protein
MHKPTNVGKLLQPRSMGLLGVARANTAVGVSPETFLLLQLMITYCFENSDNLVACAHRKYRECLRSLMNTEREQLLERVFVDTQ